MQQYPKDNDESKALYKPGFKACVLVCHNVFSLKFHLILSFLQCIYNNSLNTCTRPNYNTQSIESKNQKQNVSIELKTLAKV
jgi:hypothetical protein